jgi:hypothetical protein
MGAVQGGTLGFADELYGVGRGALDAVTGEGFNYSKRRDEARGTFDEAREDNPGSYLAGEIGGGLALPLGVIKSGATIAKAATTAPNAGRLAKAAMGARNLATAPVREGGALMVALDDLARIYGERDFRVYDVHAYNQKPAAMVSVKTVLFNQVSVNIKPGERFLRVGGTIHPGDTVDGKTRVAADAPRVDKRSLSVPARDSSGRIMVPVVEFMQLFGKTVTVE